MNQNIKSRTARVLQICKAQTVSTSVQRFDTVEANIRNETSSSHELDDVIVLSVPQTNSSLQVNQKN